MAVRRLGCIRIPGGSKNAQRKAASAQGCGLRPGCFRLSIEPVIRRLAIFLIVLTGALAPALPAIEKMLSASSTCGCVHCQCNHGTCPMMPAPARPESPATTTFVSSSVSRETAPRAVRVLRVVYLPAAAGSTPTRLLQPVAVASTASVPLFMAHCSFLI